MLCVNCYTQDYIDGCHANINLQLSTYDSLIAAARKQSGPDASQINAAIESFEHDFFNHMVLVLDHYFCHTSRTMEGKDGNPANEVRVLCNAIMNNDSNMSADKTIKLDPAKSISKYKVGDKIKLNKEAFVALFKAFFAEIEGKYSKSDRKVA